MKRLGAEKTHRPPRNRGAPLLALPLWGPDRPRALSGQSRGRVDASDIALPGDWVARVQESREQGQV